jgi:hypothetical protein
LKDKADEEFNVDRNVPPGRKWDERALLVSVPLVNPCYAVNPSHFGCKGIFQQHYDRQMQQRFMGKTNTSR